MTGSEVNERKGIDIVAWSEIGPSDACQTVYYGKEINSFWSNLFEPQLLNTLTRQTFIRLTGDSHTIKHADYYHFKKDTKIFNKKDGINAQRAATKNIEYNTNTDHYSKTMKLFENKNKKPDEQKANDLKLKESELECSICSNVYDKNKDFD